MPEPIKSLIVGGGTAGWSTTAEALPAHEDYLKANKMWADA